MPSAVEVIATTMSGSIRDWGKVERIAPLFALHGRPGIPVHRADSHAEARRLARDRVHAGVRTLICAGGSGTFIAVLEGCVDAGTPLGEITLGFLRKGSADLIGKALGMPDEIEPAVRTLVACLAEGRTEPCDVVRAAGSGPGQGPRHMVGYGGAEIFGRIPRFTETRFIKYYKGLLGQLFGDLGPFSVGTALATAQKVLGGIGRRRTIWRVRVDGEERARAAYQALIVVNGDLGPDLPFARGVPLGSGDFHLFGIRDLGLRRLPGQVRRAFAGSIARQPERHGFEHHRVERLLELRPEREGAFPVNVDGSTLRCRGAARFEIVDRVRILSARLPATGVAGAMGEEPARRGIPGDRR